MSFGKSLLTGIGISGAAITVVVITGALLDFGIKPVPVVPPGPETVHTRPIALDVSGYDLKHRTRNDILFVAARIRVADGADKDAVCRLMPRLTAVILQDFGQRVRAVNGAIAENAAALQSFLRERFNRALGKPAIDMVDILTFKDQIQAPETNCDTQTGQLR